MRRIASTIILVHDTSHQGPCKVTSSVQSIVTIAPSSYIAAAPQYWTTSNHPSTTCRKKSYIFLEVIIARIWGREVIEFPLDPGANFFWRIITIDIFCERSKRKFILKSFAGGRIIFPQKDANGFGEKALENYNEKIYLEGNVEVRSMVLSRLST